MSSGKRASGTRAGGGRRGRAAAGALRTPPRPAGHPPARTAAGPAPLWLRLRSEEVFPCLPPATHSSRFPCTSPKPSPLAATRVHGQPRGGAAAQVLAMLMLSRGRAQLFAQVVAPDRGQSPSSTFPLFFPVQTKSNEVNSSPAPPAEAGTQVNALQHRPAARAVCRLPAPAVPLRMEQNAAMGLAGNYAHLPQT